MVEKCAHFYWEHSCSHLKIASIFRDAKNELFVSAMFRLIVVYGSLFWLLAPSNPSTPHWFEQCHKGVQGWHKLKQLSHEWSPDVELWWQAGPHFFLMNDQIILTRMQWAVLLWTPNIIYCFWDLEESWILQVWEEIAWCNICFVKKQLDGKMVVQRVWFSADHHFNLNLYYTFRWWLGENGGIVGDVTLARNYGKYHVKSMLRVETCGSVSHHPFLLSCIFQWSCQSGFNWTK